MPFYGVELPFQWIDIGKTPDLWNATSMALQGQIHGFSMPGTELSPGIWVGTNTRIDERAILTAPLYIGGSTVIEAGAVLRGPCVIQSGSMIESGAVIEKSLIWHHTRISGIANISEKIIFGNHCICLLYTSDAADE